MHSQHGRVPNVLAAICEGLRQDADVHKHAILTSRVLVSTHVPAELAKL